MAPGTTAKTLEEVFTGIGQLARERPKGRGVFKDQMPFKIKIYPGGTDCVIQYVDSSAAHAAPGFFNDQELPGHAGTALAALPLLHTLHTLHTLHRYCLFDLNRITDLRGGITKL